MTIKWKNYLIYRFDDKNIVAEYVVEEPAKKDYKDKDGKITTRKGELRTVSKRLGYFSKLSTALQAVLDHYPTSGDVNGLKDVIERFNEAKQELVDVFRLNSELIESK